MILGLDHSVQVTASRITNVEVEKNSNIFEEGPFPNWERARLIPRQLCELDSMCKKFSKAQRMFKSRYNYK